MLFQETKNKTNLMPAHLVFDGNIDPMRPSIRPNPQGLVIDPYRRVSRLTLFAALYILEQGP